MGGGIMGLTLALRLKEKGEDVTIFEAAENIGGLVSPWKMDQLEWDKFYHVILPADAFTRKILKEIGVEDKIIWKKTKTGFYIKGKLYSISNTIEFLKFPTLSLIDKFRLGITILVASKIKNWKKLESIYLTDWLRKWSGKNTYEKIWLPLLRAKLGESYKETSAVFIWATIQRLYKARKSQMKTEVFGYVEGGYKTVIQAFEENLKNKGIQIKTNNKVREINGRGDLVEVKTKKNENFVFDEVICTLPSNMAAKLCTTITDQEKQKLDKIEYLGVICVAVLLDTSLSDFYITNITDQSIPFTGVIEMTALIDKEVMEGKALVYLPKYLPENDEMFDKTEEEIKLFFIRNLLKMYPSLNRKSIKFAGVAKARQVITIAKLNYSQQLPDIITSNANIHIINTSHIKDGTLNVNETIKVAEIKLNELLAHLN